MGAPGWTAILVAAAILLGGCASEPDAATDGEVTAAAREPAALPAPAPVPAPEPAPAPVADPAPDFTLLDYEGRTHRLSDYRGKVVVLEWTNHGCPYVVKFYGAGKMQEFQESLRAKGVVWLSICSSAPGKQGYYTADQWKKVDAEKKGKADAVLLDADGTVGRLYGARTTPHMFVVGTDGGLLYGGAIDDRPTANPADIEGARNYVLEAADAALAGRAPETRATKSYG